MRLLDGLHGRVGAEPCQGRFLEVVENMRRAPGEGVVGEEVVPHGVVLRGYQLAEFEREGRGDRNGAGNIAEIVGRGDMNAGRHLQDAAYHIVGIKPADVVDDAGHVGGLALRQLRRQVAQVEHHGDRQQSKQNDDSGQRRQESIERSFLRVVGGYGHGRVSMLSGIACGVPAML